MGFKGLNSLPAGLGADVDIGGRAEWAWILFGVFSVIAGKVAGGVVDGGEDVGPGGEEPLASVKRNSTQRREKDFWSLCRSSLSVSVNS